MPGLSFGVQFKHAQVTEGDDMGGEIHWKDVVNAAKATAEAAKAAYYGIKELPEALSKLGNQVDEFQNDTTADKVLNEWKKEIEKEKEKRNQR